MGRLPPPDPDLPQPLEAQAVRALVQSNPRIPLLLLPLLVLLLLLEHPQTQTDSTRRLKINMEDCHLVGREEPTTLAVPITLTITPEPPLGKDQPSNSQNQNVVNRDKTLRKLNVDNIVVVRFLMTEHHLQIQIISR